MTLRISVTVRNADFNSAIVVAVTWMHTQDSALVLWDGVHPKIMALFVKRIAIVWVIWFAVVEYVVIAELGYGGLLEA